jgi:hypothetical protein
MSIKALAIAVLQGNQQRNQRETKSFLAKKLRKPESNPGKPEIILPQWQQDDLCLAHAMFNNWRGTCPCSLEVCLISKIFDAEGKIEKLRGSEIGQGITTDMVIDSWLGSGEPEKDIFKNPAWLICMAEFLFKKNNN